MASNIELKNTVVPVLLVLAIFLIGISNTFSASNYQTKKRSKKNLWLGGSSM